MTRSTLALQRRAKRRRAARQFEAQVQELWAETDWSLAECRAYLLDPGNATLCEVCGWTFNMVCPECEKGCGCEWNCSGWRHGEWNNDDDGEWNGDLTECEGCGAGHEYECVCYHRSADEVDDEPERDWHQEWKDDQMQPAQEEPYWA